MYLRNRENISLTKKKKLQRKQKGGRTIRQRLDFLKNSISPSHIFKFRNRSNKVEQKPSQPKVKRTRTTGKKTTKATEATDAAEIAEAAIAANRAFETNSAEIAQASQELYDNLVRAMLGEEAIVTNSPVTPYSDTLSLEEEELLAELEDTDGTLSSEDAELLKELEELKNGGKKSRKHRTRRRHKKSRKYY
jgi:hypothetical protein